MNCVIKGRLYCSLLLLLSICMLAGYIIGSVYWYSASSSITIVDLNQVNIYGNVYGQCNNNNSYKNYIFVAFVSFNCNDKCVAFCSESQDDNGNNVCTPDTNEITRLAIDCIIIKVCNANTTNNTNIKFSDCYSNIQWSILETSEKSGSMYSGWIAFVVLGTVGFCVLITTIISCIVYFFCYDSESYNPNPTSSQNPQTPENHSQFVINTRDNLSEDITCSICTAIVPYKATIYNLPCEHIFHRECIKPWIIEHNNCPICRRILIPTNIQDFDIV